MASSTSSGNSRIRAGYLQFAPKLGDPVENMSRIKGLLSKTTKANLLVLPELANSGYNFESKQQALDLAEEASNSRFIDFLNASAKKLNMFIVSGFLERENDLLYNTSILIGPDGLIGKYRKIHLFMNEFDFFETGNLGLPVFDLGSFRMGMLVCFDWVFPEVWRILALKGADIICHPSNLVLPFAQQAVPVHGMINRMYIITANRHGTERDVTFSGRSFISDTKGKTLFMAPPDSDETTIAEIDIQDARDKNITERNHLFNDRIPSLYQDILKTF